MHAKQPPIVATATAQTLALRPLRWFRDEIIVAAGIGQ
jgi:hypothetical protein